MTQRNTDTTHAYTSTNFRTVAEVHGFLYASNTLTFGSSTYMCKNINIQVSVCECACGLFKVKYTQNIHGLNESNTHTYTMTSLKLEKKKWRFEVISMELDVQSEYNHCRDRM